MDHSCDLDHGVRSNIEPTDLEFKEPETHRDLHGVMPSNHYFVGTVVLVQLGNRLLVCLFGITPGLGTNDLFDMSNYFGVNLVT